MPSQSGQLNTATGLGRFLFSFMLIAFLTFLGRGVGLARIEVDINAPSIQKFQIAVPYFRGPGSVGESKGMAFKLTEIISHDLDLTGYFSLIDKRSFLAGESATLTLGAIRFRDWSTIGAELLLYGAYTLNGKDLEIEARLFDVFSGRQIVGKRVRGDTDDYRHMIHRLANEIIIALTGQKGMFLTKIAFVSDVSGHKEVYLCDFDGYNLRQVTRDKVIALLPRLSPDGKKITYTSYKEGSPRLYLKDLPTGVVSRLSARSGLNSGVSWAADSRTVVFTISRKGNPDLYRVDVSGHILNRLTTYDGIDVSPALSPDGRRMAFVSDRSGSPQIYVLDLDTGKVQRLTFPGIIGNYNTSPSWSALNRIVFVSLAGGRLDIFSMDPNGGRVKRLTDGQGKNEDPCWSPDGRYIVFSSNRGGDYKLYIMNANGQNQRQITFLKGNQTSPSWAP